jgi:hypothetical protein
MAAQAPGKNIMGPSAAVLGTSLRAQGYHVMAPQPGRGADKNNSALATLGVAVFFSRPGPRRGAGAESFRSTKHTVGVVDDGLSFNTQSNSLPSILKPISALKQKRGMPDELTTRRKTIDKTVQIAGSSNYGGGQGMGAQQDDSHANKARY